MLSMKVIKLSMILQSTVGALLHCGQAIAPEEQGVFQYLQDTYLALSAEKQTAQELPVSSQAPTPLKQEQKKPSDSLKKESAKQPPKGPKYVRIYGDPKKATSVLVVFTAMACPICTEFHQQVLPRLKKYMATHKDKLAVIIRDYPSDPLSLKVSAIVWRYPQHAADLMEHLFMNSEKWVTLSETDSLQKVKILAKEMLAPLKDSRLEEGIDHATGMRTLLKNIFDERLRDKKALGITVVPTLFMVHKSPQKTHLIDNPPSYEAIMGLIESPALPEKK
jgi:protein-disulfide isomerase